MFFLYFTNFYISFNRDSCILLHFETLFFFFFETISEDNSVFYQSLSFGRRPRRSFLHQLAINYSAVSRVPSV